MRIAHFIGVIAVCASVHFAGCGSLEPSVPAVTAAVAAAARADIGELEHGRLIYTTRCVECHAAERIPRYSRVEWMEILPRMADEARLNDAQDRAVRAYVMAFATR
jgi:mono/diheme cytochrome c family protein